MKLNRSLQRTILEQLRTAYPSIVDCQVLPEFDRDGAFQSNIFYLEEHHLIQSVAKSDKVCGRPPMILTAKITAAGLDFLEDDGGLGAILNKVTVKFDSDDLCKLLSLKVDQLQIAPDKKDNILSTIKQLPAETLRTVYIRLIEYGLDKAPDAYKLLQTYLVQPT